MRPPAPAFCALQALQPSRRKKTKSGPGRPRARASITNCFVRSTYARASNAPDPDRRPKKGPPHHRGPELGAKKQPEDSRTVAVLGALQTSAGPYSHPISPLSRHCSPSLCSSKRSPLARRAGRAVEDGEGAILSDGGGWRRRRREGEGSWALRASMRDGAVAVGAGGGGWGGRAAYRSPLWAKGTTEAGAAPYRLFIFLSVMNRDVKVSAGVASNQPA